MEPTDSSNEPNYQYDKVFPKALESWLNLAVDPMQGNEFGILSEILLALRSLQSNHLKAFTQQVMTAFVFTKNAKRVNSQTLNHQSLIALLSTIIVIKGPGVISHLRENVNSEILNAAIVRAFNAESHLYTECIASDMAVPDPLLQQPSSDVGVHVTKLITELKQPMAEPLTRVFATRQITQKIPHVVLPEDRLAERKACLENSKNDGLKRLILEFNILQSRHPVDIPFAIEIGKRC